MYKKSLLFAALFTAISFTASAQVVVVAPPHPVLVAPAPPRPGVVVVREHQQPVVVRKTVVRHPRRRHGRRVVVRKTVVR